MKNFLFLFLLLSTVVGVAQPPVAQLPQTYIDTTYALPTGGTVWAAHTAAQLSSALQTSAPGDVIVLDASVTYSGNFSLRVKANPNNKWIYIVGSAYSALPAPGTRVNPTTDAANMPKIVSPGVTAPVTIPPGANHYRLVGLEIYSTSTQGCNPNSSPPQNCYTYQLVSGTSVPGQSLVDSITVDRCYLHGSPTQDVQRAVQANGSNFAVIDSYISDIHMGTYDSQAVAAYYSPGPIKIVNNFLSATTEDVIFGGAGGMSNPFVAADVEIRNNHFFKPMSWDAVGVTIPPGNKWIVKNHLEFKSAKRVLVDGNTLENIWVSGQMGYSIVLTPRTSSSGLSAVVDDITIRNNIFMNVSTGFELTAFDDACLPANGCTNPGEAKRVVFYNNLFQLGDTTQHGYTSGYAYGGLLFQGETDFAFQHNTVIPPPNLGYCKASIYFSSGPVKTPPVSVTHNVWILDNALCRQILGPQGWVGQFSYVLFDYMGDPSPVNPRLLGNVFYAPTGDKVYAYPPHNYVSTAPFVYVNPSAGNYQLLVPNWTDTSDGKISGVDSSTLP